MSKRVSRMGWIVLATLLSLALVILPACGGEQVVNYNLTIGSSTGGSTTPAAGTHTYAKGTVVNLTATAGAGYQFVNWTGGPVADVNDATTTITMNGDYLITANFQQTAVPTSVLVNPQGYPEDPGLTPERGGTLTIIHSSPPSNLGAYWLPGGGWDAPQSRFALEKLIGLGPTGELEPQLATAWETDATAKTVTLTLRQGVKFHDGTAFNAAAVKWCLEKYRDQPGGGTELDLATLIEAVNDYTVKLTFSAWDPNFLRNLMSTGAGIIVSPAAAEANGANAKLIPVGTGPFKFVKYEQDSRLTYTKNEDYWQDGLPYLDGVVIEYVTDPVTRILAFKNGDGDVMNEFSTADALNLRSEGYEVLSRVVHIKGIVADSTAAPFNNIKVRQAMAYAVATATEVLEVFDGQYTYTNQAALPGLTGFNSGIVGYSYNVAKAKQLLQEAGYNTTNRLTTTLYYTAADCTDYFTVVQNYLAAVGIDVTLSLLTRGPYSGKSGNGWDGLLELQFSYNGFELMYDQSLTMGMSPGSSKHKDIAYPQAYIDKYNAMLLETSSATREQMYRELNKMAIDDYCLVWPMFAYQVFSARQSYVHDFGFGVKASEYTPEIIWLDQ